MPTQRSPAQRASEAAGTDGDTPEPRWAGGFCRDSGSVLPGSPVRCPSAPSVPFRRAACLLPFLLTRFPSLSRLSLSAVFSLLGCSFRPRFLPLGLALCFGARGKQSDKQFLPPRGLTLSPRSVFGPLPLPSLSESPPPRPAPPLFPGPRSARHKLASPSFPPFFAPAGPRTEVAEFPLLTSLARPSGSGVPWGRWSWAKDRGCRTSRSSAPRVLCPQARVQKVVSVWSREAKNILQGEEQDW